LISIDPEGEKSLALLSLAVKGRENEYLNEVLSNLGFLMNFKMAGYQAFTFFDLVKDSKGKAKYFLMLSHRLSNLSQQYFIQTFRKGNPHPKWKIGILSNDCGKMDFGFSFPSAEMRTLRRVLGESDNAFFGWLPDIEGNTHFVSAMRGKKNSYHILSAAFSAEKIIQDAHRVKREYWLSLGFLLLLLLSIALWLRRILLNPLQDLHRCVSEMERGNYEIPPAEPAIGEMGILGEVFNRTLENLKQLDLAKTVQENFLPKGVVHAGKFKIQGFSKMMSEVGGDYFDILHRSETQKLVVIGDVSGHGLSAAMVMAMVKSALGILIQTPLKPNEMMTILNEHLLRILARKKMMTCIIGSLDVTTGSFSFSNAGHNFPLFVPAEGEEKLLKQPAVPLGSLRGRPYKLDTFDIRPGDTLILYTDGVVEARDTANKILGYENLAKFVKNLPTRDPEEMIREIFSLLERYTQGNLRQDDITVLIVKHQL